MTRDGVAQGEQPMIAINEDAYASAYWRPRRIVIGAMARTVHRAHIGTEWWTLPASATHAEVGSAIRKALLAFQAYAPHPDFRSAEWKALGKARQRAAGVRNERQYMSGSKLVHVNATGDGLVFIPTRNGGTTGPDSGYHELAALPATVPLVADDDRVGIALAEALACCT